MAVALQSAYARSSRRIRLVFGGELGLGAFALGFYSVAALDAWGAAVSPLGVMAVSARPGDVELALDRDLTPGARYRIDVAAGVPDALNDPSLAASATVTLGQQLRSASAAVTETTLVSAIFQDDLAHDGIDFVEAPSGDLEALRGVENGRASVRRRASAAGLRWDDTYGPGLREFVDAPVFGLYAARGRILENLRRDDRVRSVDADMEATVLEEDSGTVTIPVAVEFVGGFRDQVQVQRA